MEGGLELTWRTLKRLCSMSICIAGRFFLVHSMDLDQARVKNWPATKVAFFHFEKNLFLHMGSHLDL